MALSVEDDRAGLDLQDGFAPGHRLKLWNDRRPHDAGRRRAPDFPSRASARPPGDIVAGRGIGMDGAFR